MLRATIPGCNKARHTGCAFPRVSPARLGFDHGNTLHRSSLTCRPHRGGQAMKSPICVAAMTVAVALGAGSVSAQTTTGTIVTTDPLTIPAEQEILVREYIVRRPVDRIVEFPGGT